jgi:hypothetical protein
MKGNQKIFLHLTQYLIKPIKSHSMVKMIFHSHWDSHLPFKADATSYLT